MIELRESTLLRGKELAASGRKPRVAQDFYRNLAAKIRAFGKVHDAHAAFTERSLNAVGAELLERRRGGRWFVQNVMRHLSDIAVEHGSAAGIFLQQDHYFGNERRITGALVFKKNALLGFGKFGRLMKQSLDFLPASAVHLCSSNNRKKESNPS